MLRARRRHQPSPGHQAAERLQVHVLVAPEPGLEVAPAAHEGRRVEDDQIVAVVAGAQEVEDVGHDEAAGGRGEAVLRPRGLGELECGPRGVDRHDFPRPRPGRHDREGAAVGEGVQDAPACGERAEPAARLALVEVEARLLTVVQVDHEPGAIFLDREAQRGRLAGEDAACPGEALLRAHRSLASLEDTSRVKALLDRGDDGGRQARRTRGQELADDEVPVPIDHDPGQAIAFAVDHAVGLESPAEHLAPERERLVEAADQRRVDRLVRAGEEADGDRRPRIAVPSGEEAAVRRQHAHRLARLCTFEAAGDRAREYPRVTGPDGALAPRLEGDHTHRAPRAYRSPGRMKVPLRPPLLRTRRT